MLDVPDVPVGVNATRCQSLPFPAMSLLLSGLSLELSPFGASIVHAAAISEGHH